MTTLMPRKGQLAALSARPLPESRLQSNRPRQVLDDPPTRQFVMPTAAPKSASAPSMPSAPSLSPMPMVVANNAKMLARAANAATKPSAARPVPPPYAASAKSDSDAKIDPPATVITTRTRIIPARPTVSWAAALVAMGVFVGLVTAVVARGDADSLIDATASFVDPSGNHAVAGSASIASLQTKFATPNPALPTAPDSTLAPSKDEGEMKAVALADLPTASPTPQRPAPVAYAAPRATPRAMPRPAPRPAPVAVAPREREEKVAVAKKEAPAPKAVATSRGKASDDDVESASAADALAKAQLEASLR